MVATYGADSGFNWHLGSVVGAQVVSVPMSVPLAMASHAFASLVQSLVAVFAATLIVLNIMLTLIVIRPVRQLSHANVEGEDLPIKGRDEISGLTTSFNRMQRSLKKAMAVPGENWRGENWRGGTGGGEPAGGRTEHAAE